jgi:hypothetical protein
MNGRVVFVAVAATLAGSMFSGAAFFQDQENKYDAAPNSSLRAGIGFGKDRPYDFCIEAGLTMMGFWPDWLFLLAVMGGR